MTTTLLDHPDPRHAPQPTGPTLTLVPLDHPRLRHALRRPDDATALHRAVMSLLPDDLPPGRARHAAGVLHRLDQPARGPARLLLQHQHPLRAELRNDPQLRHADLQPLLNRMTTDTTVTFRIVLNAVRVQTGTGHRIAITDPDELHDWGSRRLHTAGLTQIHLTDLRTNLTRGKAAVWTAQYDGQAHVQDPTAVHIAIREGLGRARAYGCGLLSLAVTA